MFSSAFFNIGSISEAGLPSSNAIDTDLKTLGSNPKASKSQVFSLPTPLAHRPHGPSVAPTWFPNPWFPTPRFPTPWFPTPWFPTPWFPTPWFPTLWFPTPWFPTLWFPTLWFPTLWFQTLQFNETHGDNVCKPYQFSSVSCSIL